MLADASPVYLLSPWKPLLIVVTFIAWAWLVGTKLDKDARFFHLKVVQWNAIQCAAAGTALVIMLVSGSFYIGFPLGSAVMAAPIWAYWRHRNAEVPPDKQFHLGGGDIRRKLQQRKLAKASERVALHFTRNGKPVPVPGKEDAQLPLYIAAESQIALAMEHRASRLEFHLTSKGCQVARFVDGIAEKHDPIPAEDAARLFAFLKSMAGCDPEDIRRRQGGDFGAEGAVDNATISLTASGSRGAQVLRLEFDRRSRALRTLETIGLIPAQIEELRRHLAEGQRHGVVLVGGSAQQGLTTTGYALVAAHDAYLCNIRTLEHEVVAEVEGITHTPLDGDPAAGGYAAQLQTIIRRDPEVVLACDLPDAESAKVASKMGLDGPLVYVTLAASSLPETLSHWAGLIGDPRQAFGCLRGAIFQRLVRRLCENCRVAYVPSPELAKKGLPIDTVEHLCRVGGQIQMKNKVVTCPVCGGAGFLGQIAVFETVFLDEEARKHLIAGDLKAATAHARRAKRMIRLQEAGWAHVAAEITSLEEFGRVLGSKKKDKTQSEATAPST